MGRLLLLLSLVPSAEAPLVGRPRERFFGAVGEQVRISLQAIPRQVEVGQPIVLTLLVHGLDDPASMQRPDLRKLPEFAESFHIDDLPDDGSVRSERLFRYQLRAKNEQVQAIPPLLMHYYDPRLNYFATTASPEVIDLKVTPKGAGELARLPMQEPDFLFEQLEDDELLDRPLPGQAQLLLLLAALLLPPLGLELWYLQWRLRNPSEARLAQLRRSRAVRVALDRLAETRHYEPAVRVGQVVTIVRHYLRERVNLPEHAGTAQEIVAALKQSGVSPTLIEPADLFFRASEAARFGPPNDASADIAKQAREFILAVEESA